MNASHGAGPIPYGGMLLVPVLNVVLQYLLMMLLEGAGFEGDSVKWADMGDPASLESSSFHKILLQRSRRAKIIQRVTFRKFLIANTVIDKGTK